MFKKLSTIHIIAIIISASFISVMVAAFIDKIKELQNNESIKNNISIESRVFPSIRSLKDMKIGELVYIKYLSIPKDFNDVYINPESNFSYEKDAVYDIPITFMDSGYLVTIPKSKSFERSLNSSKRFIEYGYIKVQIQFE